MFGIRGKKRTASLDSLGYLVPPGRLGEAQLARGLREAMDRRRFLSGHGVPSAPTRYVVSMHPADRVNLHPATEDRLARALASHAERSGCVILGPIEIECEVDASAQPGRPMYWAGFAEDDLLVLSSADAAAAVFARADAGAATA